MAKQLNRHAVPWEPIKVPVPQPPPAVKYQYPTNYYNISDQYSYYYYYYSYYYCRRQEEEFTYYNYYSSYNNNTSHHHHHHHHHQSSTVVEPSSEVGGGQYGVVFRSSGEREVVKTYKRGAVRRIDGGGGGGPTDLGGGLKRVLNVPPRFRGRFVQSRVSRSFGLQWKPKAEISSKFGGGGGSGGSAGGCCGGGGGKTSVMIKNIPNQYRREMLIEFIDKLCEKNQLEYDFLYLPMDFLRKNSLGYAFVNFTSAAAATRIRELLQGYKWGRIQTHCGSFSSSKICEVTYARIQGKEALVQNFANSTFCCDNNEWLPVTFTPPRNGLRPGSSEQRTIGKWRARISY